MLLRLYLAVVNTEANDDHLAVIRIIANQHRLPALREAWEGFQPKLYHVSVALLWNLSPWQSLAVRIRIAQFVSCAAGIATLYVVQRALARRPISPSVRLIAFALVALNPSLIGLNAQATNDSFVILFGTIAIDQGSEFFRTGTWRTFLVMTASVALAVISKGNGLVLFIAVTAALMYGIVRRQNGAPLTRGQFVGASAAFIAAVMVLAGMFGSYRANWRDTGNAFAINGEPAPLPHLIERTYVYRPGVTSIADAYFTFRLVDMLQHPAITNDPVVYPLHRTSLWSQLYGRAHVVHFAQHPPSWRNTSFLVATISRLILLCALVPTTLVLAGLIRTLWRLVGAWPLGSVGPDVTLTDVLLAATGLGFLAFMVAYSISYRDFSTMKAEFLFPGLLAYIFLFADEAERASTHYGQFRGMKYGMQWAYGVLLSLYVADAAILAVQLT